MMKLVAEKETTATPDADSLSMLQNSPGWVWNAPFVMFIYFFQELTCLHSLVYGINLLK